MFTKFTKEELDKFRKAGKVAAEALSYGKSLIKPGARLLEVCEKIEKFIISKKAGIGFPAQISCNEIAAHFCPDSDDTTVFDKQVACLDVGVEVDGYIADNALTVDLSGKYTDLVKASREALDAAVKMAVPGAKTNLIGKEIARVIENYGFKPVKNLSGHGIGRYEIHTAPGIPNYFASNGVELVEGQVIAIEPFASTGAGMIYDSGNPTVFELVNRKSLRVGREVVDFVANGLPFTTRWLTSKFGKAKALVALKQMKDMEMIQGHAPLVDKEKGIVSQAEHSIIVGEGVFTK